MIRIKPGATIFPDSCSQSKPGVCFSVFPHKTNIDCVINAAIKKKLTEMTKILHFPYTFCI